MAAGGIVATATMAEVGFWADFMAWVKRMPVWSFPRPVTRLDSLVDLATVYYDRAMIKRLETMFIFEQRPKVRQLPMGKEIKLFQYA